MTKQQMIPHKETVHCALCKQEIRYCGWNTNGKVCCETCSARKGWVVVWELDMKLNLIPRYHTVKTPRLDPKTRYALQDKKAKTWAANITDLRQVPEAGDARWFCGEWLNNTQWQWSDWFDARTKAQIPKKGPKK